MICRGGVLNGVRFVCVTGPAQMVHEEHGTIDLPVRPWEVGRVREYDHFAEEARVVKD